MSIQQTHEAEEAINKGNIELLRDDLDFIVLASIIESDRFDLIEKIYDYFKDTEPMKQYIFDAVIKSAGVGVTPTSVQCLDFLLSLEKNVSYTFDDEDDLYYMCQNPGNVELFKRMIELNSDIPWGYVLQVGCNFIRRESVDFLIKNIKFSPDDINRAFSDLVNSSVTTCYHENADQSDMISWFIRKLNANVNLETDSDWGRAYLDCFMNAPNAAKNFYVESFDCNIISSERFWSDFIDAYIEDDKFKSAYTLAFEDLRCSGIDLTELSNIFNRLGYDELAHKLLN